MFAERLKHLRVNRGLSQESLAKKFGLAQQTYGHWETGRTQPDQAMLIRLADFFDVSIDYLLGRTDNPNSNLNKLSREDMEILEKGRKIKNLPPDKRKIAEKTMEILLGEDEQSATKSS